jgi:hypothetical protein
MVVEFLTGITFFREGCQHQEKPMCSLEAHPFEMLFINYIWHFSFTG